MDTHTTDDRNRIERAATPGKPYHMECVIYKGKDSEKYIREFERKKVELLRKDLIKLSDEELDILDKMLEKLKKDKRRTK